MAKLFTITPAIRRLARDANDTMIEQLGKECLLAFEPTALPCPNCHYDPILKASTGIYNGTGSAPFTHPPCPVCKGAGILKPTGDLFTENLFLIDWQPKPWLFVDTTQIKIPQGIVQTKGFITDMAEVLEAKYIIIDHLNTNFRDNRFVLWGEPIPQGNIVPGRYFIAFWTRLGAAQ
jgi:hypothetical protein